MSVVVVSCFEWALCHSYVVDVVSRRFIDDALAAESFGLKITLDPHLSSVDFFTKIANNSKTIH